jgi:UDP-GlcNAc:undecaprenyl-phosphate GlcNAc-1-phosphate transferase
MALAIPLLDTAAAIIRRFIRRQPIFSPDRNHVHHRLLDRGFSPRKVALVIYGACGLAAAFSIIQTMPHNKFHGVLLILFCVAAWLGVQFVGYLEFDVARSLTMSGTFRHIVNARMSVEGFERKLAVATTPEDYWLALRDVSREFDFPHVRMCLADVVYEHCAALDEGAHGCTIRIPLSDVGYVNFRYPSNASVRHAAAITPIVEILQRSIVSCGRPGITLAEPVNKTPVPVQHRVVVAPGIGLGAGLTDSGKS